MTASIDRIRSQSAETRKQHIVDVFAQHFIGSMTSDPDAWRGKFRKMAATAFAFYRGSAALFYADINGDDDPFLNDQTRQV